MSSYQVLFNGQVAQGANPDAVRNNMARELGLDERKAKQLFSGRTVVVRSQLEQAEAAAWQSKFSDLGAICRIKNMEPKPAQDFYDADKLAHDNTLRDITAAHLECPRCGHMQLDACECARCGVDLDRAFKQKRKEDLLIEKKIREMRGHNAPNPAPVRKRIVQQAVETPQHDQETQKKGVLGWLKMR